MSSNIERSMNLDFNAIDVQRSRTMSLSDLMLDELLSPVKPNCRNLTSAAMTPTTTQFLFPSSVTAEQEAYASGFSRALEEIYRSETQQASQPKVVSTANVIPSTVTLSQLTTLNNVSVERFNSFACVPSQSLATAGICSNTIWPVTKTEVSADMPLLVGGQPVKNHQSELPRMNCGNGLVFNQVTAVPSSLFPRYSSPVSALSVGNHGSVNKLIDTFVPTCSPTATGFFSNSSSRSVAADSTVSGTVAKLDMDDQDHRRLERKRAKNRVAAARCQMRKMERITRLQEKVQELRDNNARLSQTVAELTNHVSSLRKQILMHTERGCRMMIPALS